MYRRHRRAREIPFSFDSFLDLVANVNGVILRLILVAWVGARAYNEFLPPPTLTDVPPDLPPLVATALPDPGPEDDPLTPELQKQRDELARLQAELLAQLKQFDMIAARKQQADAERAALEQQIAGARSQQAALAHSLESGTQAGRSALLSLEDVQKRSQELAAQIEALRQAPSQKKTLSYLAPVSAEVASKTRELEVEIKGGRVTAIDYGGLLAEAQRMVRDKIELFQKQWDYQDTTPPVGPFRMHFVAERVRSERDVGEGVGPADKGGYRVGLSSTRLEPIDAERGEPAEKALAKGSAFRRVVEGQDAKQTVVTIWVYPDSFAEYRQVRDWLHGQQFVVAGRPLPEGHPIMANRSGSKSRGQ